MVHIARRNGDIRVYSRFRSNENRGYWNNVESLGRFRTERSSVYDITSAVRWNKHCLATSLAARSDLFRTEAEHDYHQPHAR